MREHEIVFDEALAKGLNPLSRTRWNSKYLDEFLGFRLGTGGPEIYESLGNPLPAAIDMHYIWPFPRMIIGERYNFLIVRMAVRDHVWIISDDMVTASYAGSALRGTMFHVADFGEYAYLTNGSGVLYWDTTAEAWVSAGAMTNIPLMRAVCNFRGQAVGGNVVSDWYDCDETYYIWSNIGEMNFTLSRRNESGYRRDPMGGEIMHVAPLGDSVIGYTSKGVTRLFPVGSPAPTFGCSEVHNVGLVNQGAMAASPTTHVYVGKDYHLRKIGNVGELSYSVGSVDLGYETQMRLLADEEIAVSYNPLTEDFYIGNSSKTFLLTAQGLSEIPQHPSTVWAAGDTAYMLPASEDDFYPLIVTAPFDMGFSGQKTISSIETDAGPVDTPEAAVDYYMTPNSYETTPYVPMNNQGNCALTAVGNAFRVRFRFQPTYSDTVIGYLRARFKISDLRAVRGVFSGS